MILTNCAACAAPLAHNAPRCVRCWTRYCDSTCQHDHWRRGHKQMCKKVHRGGNAEQYNADKKYKEAVAVAVEACADDTKGQTCYICTQALHWKTKEGLVRGCSCRGTAGFAHVSCLAEQAKILVAEAEENNLGDKVLNERWARWYKCSLCEQHHHGVVRAALGWACWKTYLGRPEANWLRRNAMTQLGNGLSSAGHHEDALSVKEAELSIVRRVGTSGVEMIAMENNLAATYHRLKRFEEASRTFREVYSGFLKIYGKQHKHTVLAANNYADSLMTLKRFEEARSILLETMPVARRVLGEGNDITILMKLNYAGALCNAADGATLDNVCAAVTILEEADRTARRVLGSGHPTAKDTRTTLERARRCLANLQEA